MRPRQDATTSLPGISNKTIGAKATGLALNAGGTAGCDRFDFG